MPRFHYLERGPEGIGVLVRSLRTYAVAAPSHSCPKSTSQVTVRLSIEGMGFGHLSAELESRRLGTRSRHRSRNCSGAVGLTDGRRDRNPRGDLLQKPPEPHGAWESSTILKAFSAGSVKLRYDDEPCGEHYTGRDGVCLFYEQLMKALPDLGIKVQRRHMAEDAVLVEVVVRGTHLGGWRGLPATGRQVKFPLCGVYTFDADDCLAGEGIYYDRGSVLRQLGVFYEPRSILGQICNVATHPITIARAFGRKLLRDRPSFEGRKPGNRCSSVLAGLLPLNFQIVRSQPGREHRCVRATAALVTYRSRR